MKRLLQFHAMGFAVLLIVSTMPVFGQAAARGVIVGTVSDQNGGVIPDTTVELINPATNESKTVKTNQSGQYVFPSATPGTYTLKFTKQGFATTNIGNVTENVAKRYTYDIRLEIKSGKEVVEVAAYLRAEQPATDL